MTQSQLRRSAKFGCARYHSAAASSTSAVERAVRLLSMYVGRREGIRTITDTTPLRPRSAIIPTAGTMLCTVGCRMRSRPPNVKRKLISDWPLAKRRDCDVIAVVQEGKVGRARYHSAAASSIGSRRTQLYMKACTLKACTPCARMTAGAALYLGERSSGIS